MLNSDSLISISSRYCFFLLLISLTLSLLNSYEMNVMTIFLHQFFSMNCSHFSHIHFMIIHIQISMNSIQYTFPLNLYIFRLEVHCRLKIKKKKKITTQISVDNFKMISSDYFNISKYERSKSNWTEKIKALIESSDRYLH